MLRDPGLEESHRSRKSLVFKRWSCLDPTRDHLSMSERRIFICDRREDTGGHAGRLYDRLNQRFPDQVFRDLDRIPLLKEWNTVVDESLRSCEVALVLIGQRWLGVSQNGTRRLDEADDPVRREISAV